MSVRDPWQVQYTQSQHRIPLPDRGGKLAKSFVKILDEEKNVKKRWGTTTVFTKFLLIFCHHQKSRRTTSPSAMEEAEELGEDLVSFEGEEYAIVDDNEDEIPIDDDGDDNDDENDGSELAESLSAVQMDDEEAQPEDHSMCTLAGHTDSVYSVAMHRDTANEIRVITGAGDDTAMLWRVSILDASDASIQPVEPQTAADSTAPPPVPFSETSASLNAMATSISILGGHTDSVAAVAFSSDGTLCATGGLDGLVKVWDAQDGTFKRTLEGPSDVDWLTWHSKGNVLLAGSSDGTVWMWLAATGACMQVFAGHEGAVTCGIFTPDGKGIITGGADATVRVWAPKKGTCRHIFSGQNFHEAPITCLAAHPNWQAGESDQNLVMCGGEDGVAKLMHIGSKKVVASFSHSTGETFDSSTLRVDGSGSSSVAASAVALSVEAVGLSSVQPWAVTAGIDGTCKIWDIQGSRLRRIIRCEGSGAVTSVSWHPNLPCLLAGSADGKIRLWDARAGVETPVHEFSGHADMVVGLASSFNFEGKGSGIIVSANGDHTSKLYHPSCRVP